MPTTLETAVSNYLRFGTPARGTRAEYQTTLRKWKRWDGGVPIENLGRKEIREFLDWVHEHAVAEGCSNPGRTANKAREHLRAVISWAWDQELIQALPRFPKPKPQRDVAGRHYLTKAEINALYFATHKMPRPRGWQHALPVGTYWRCALVLFFNYGLDTGTVWDYSPDHDPILWRHISWQRQAPDGQTKSQSPWGWLFYRRPKTGKAFHRPMNRVVHAHLKSIAPEEPQPGHPVLLGGAARPNTRFRELCQLARIKPKKNVETGQDEPWVLKDLRKTCATYYDAHVLNRRLRSWGIQRPESPIALRPSAPLAFKAIMTLPQPTAFMGLVRGFDRECPCCRRPFADA